MLLTLNWFVVYKKTFFKTCVILNSKTAAARIREAIHSNITYSNTSHYGPFFDQEPTWGTTHVSVQGPDGEVVSATRLVEPPKSLYKPKLCNSMV